MSARNQQHHHIHHHGPPGTAPSPPPLPSKPNPRNLLSFLLKSIIMALIISLFLLFLGVAALALLHFLFASTTLHRHRLRLGRRAATQFSMSSSSSAYSFQDLQECLPKIRYAVVSQPNTGKDCAVCLESFKNGEWCRILPNCNHTFHQSCVDKWLTKVPNCPICRALVRLDSGQSSFVSSNDDYSLS